MNLKNVLDHVLLLYNSTVELYDERLIDVFHREINIIRRTLIEQKMSINIRSHDNSIMSGVIIGLVINNTLAVRLMTDNGVYTIETDYIIY